MPHLHNLKAQFLLDPSITYLNFGSFGACPRPVFADYQKWQLELEREPVQFIAVNGVHYLRRSREALAAYVGCEASDLVYVTNPSYGVNLVAKSLRLQPGDEILTTELEYGACEKAISYYCEQKGLRLVKQPLSFPLSNKEETAREFFKGVSDRTRLIFISQITSATALILPVQEICAMARERGIMTFVDGAHAPGQVPLHLASLGADIYTGACHKWMMSAKGCSFLYVRKELQGQLDPLVVSWGYDPATPAAARFLAYHEMQGTRDFSAFLTVPAAIKFMKEHNWSGVAGRCREMVKENAERFCALLGTRPLCRISDDFLAQMLSLRVNTEEPERLQGLLFEKYRIEIPVMRQNGYCYLRYSINGFNKAEDLDQLYLALSEILAQTALLKH